MDQQRVAVVTGANRGIGLATVQGLRAAGFQVVLTARNEAAGQAEAVKLGVAFHPLDVTSDASVTTLAEWVDRTYGRCDVLINNAGLMLDRGQSILRVGMDTFQQTLNANTLGPLRLAQAFVPLMRRNKYGRIVNLSTTMAQFGNGTSGLGRGYGAYRTSKAALNAITVILAAELANTGILVNAMHPGWVQTEMGGAGAQLPPEAGADTVIHLSTLPEGGPTGGFFEQRQQIAW